MKHHNELMKSLLVIASWLFAFMAAVPIVVAGGFQVITGGIVTDTAFAVAIPLMLSFVIGAGGLMVTGSMRFAMWALCVKAPCPSSHLKPREPIQLCVCRRLCIATAGAIALAAGLYALRYLYGIYHPDSMVAVVNPYETRQHTWRLVAAAISLSGLAFFGVVWIATARKWHRILTSLAESPPPGPREGEDR